MGEDNPKPTSESVNVDMHDISRYLEIDLRVQSEYMVWFGAMGDQGGTLGARIGSSDDLCLGGNA